jgi:type IV secretion system protein TrbL
MSVCDVPAIAAVCDVAGEAAGSLVSAPFNWLAEAMAATATWLFEGLWTLLDTTTVVDLTSPGYVAVYNLVFGIAIFVMLLFFFLQLGKGLLQRDPTVLRRAATGLGRSVVGSFVALGLCVTGLEIVDQLALGLVHATGTSMEQLGGRLAASVIGLTALPVAAPMVGPILTSVLSGLAITGVVLVWLTLLLRQAMLLVVIVLAPVALAGWSWDATRGWVARWGSLVLALAVSKLVIVVVLLVGTAQVAAPIAFDLGSVADPLSGVVLMFVAAFAPYMSYKFISFASTDGHLTTSAEQETRGALTRPVHVPAYRLAQARSILGPARSTSAAPAVARGTIAPMAAGGAGVAGATVAGAGPAIGRAVARAADAQSPAAPTPTGGDRARRGEGNG